MWQCTRYNTVHVAMYIFQPKHAILENYGKAEVYILQVPSLPSTCESNIREG